MSKYTDDLAERGITDIYICAHCGAIEEEEKDLKPVCRLSSIKTKTENVIARGQKVSLFDFNPLVVQAERDRRQAIKDERKRLKDELNK